MGPVISTLTISPCMSCSHTNLNQIISIRKLFQDVTTFTKHRKNNDGSKSTTKSNIQSKNWTVHSLQVTDTIRSIHSTVWNHQIWGFKVDVFCVCHRMTRCHCHFSSEIIWSHLSKICIESKTSTDDNMNSVRSFNQNNTKIRFME